MTADDLENAAEEWQNMKFSIYLDEYFANVPPLSEEGLRKQLERLQKIPFPNDISLKELRESWYFQQRSSAVVIANESQIDSETVQSIELFRQLSKHQADFLIALAKRENEIYLPDWWGVFIDDVKEKGSESSKRALELSEFNFTNRIDLAIGVSFGASGPKLHVPLFIRSFFFEFSKFVLRIYSKSIEEFGHSYRLAVESLRPLEKQSVLKYIDFANNYFSITTLPVAHPRSVFEATISQYSATSATTFILLHELAHVVLHSDSAFETLDGSKIWHRQTQRFGGLNAADRILKIRHPNIEDADAKRIKDLISNNLDKSIECDEFYSDLADLDDPMMSKYEAAELEADHWALEELLHQRKLTKVDNSEYSTHIVFGAYLAVAYSSLAQISIGKKTGRNFDEIKAFSQRRMLRMRRHLISKVDKPGPFQVRQVPSMIDLIDALHVHMEEIILSKSSSFLNELVEAEGGFLMMNTAVVPIRMEIADHKEVDRIVQAVDEVGTKFLQNQGEARVTVSDRRVGFGIGEILELSVSFAGKHVDALTVSLLANAIFALCTGSVRRIFVGSKETKITQESIEQAVLAAIEKIETAKEGDDQG